MHLDIVKMGFRELESLHLCLRSTWFWASFDISPQVLSSIASYLTIDVVLGFLGGPEASPQSHLISEAGALSCFEREIALRVIGPPR